MDVRGFIDQHATGATRERVEREAPNLGEATEASLIQAGINHVRRITEAGWHAASVVAHIPDLYFKGMDSEEN